MSITLHVPSDYTTPSIFRTTTPEENAMILSIGPAIIQTLRATNYDERVQQIRNQLDRSTNQNTDLIKAIHAIETRIVEAVNEKLSDVNTDILSSVGDIHIEPDKELKREVKKLSEQVTSLLSHTSNVAASEKMMEKLDVALSELDKIKHRSVIKGAINEHFTERMIVDTFSTPGSGFKMRSSVYKPGDKQIRSGDHIIEWYGTVIMFEDKDYQKEVGTSQVEKAIRDFELHPECDVLIMISMNTPIRGHETAEGIKAVVYGERLVLYVSNFAHNVDMYGYMRRVIQPIIMATKPVLQRVSRGNNLICEYIETVLPIMLTNIESQERDLERMLKDMKAHVISVQNSILNQRNSINSMISKLTDREEVVNGDDYAEPAQCSDTTTRKAVSCSWCKGKGFFAEAVGHNSRSCKRRKEAGE